jgi:predicted DNA-binding protein
MATLTHKIQILLDDQQHQELLALAKTQGKTLSALLREAVVEHLLKEARRTARQKAFEEISAMTLPVADWSEMEKEIAWAHAGRRKRP